MNIQTSRAIYDMPIISPQHAHWRAVRKLFDKKVQVVHHRFQRIFNLNDGTAESGGGREAWKLEPRRATLAANITLSSFLRRNYGSDPRVRQQTSCFPPQSWPFITFRLTLHLLLFGYYETIWNTLILISLLQLKTHSASQKPWHPQAPCATCADKKTPWRPIATACKNF